MNSPADVLVAQGDLAGARARYQESLDLINRLAAADPSSASLQRDVWVSMWRRQRFPGSGVTWALIAAAMEDMDLRGVLAPNDRKSFLLVLGLRTSVPQASKMAVSVIVSDELTSSLECPWKSGT